MILEKAAVSQPTAGATIGSDALKTAAAALQSATAAEETRFSNLNSRALSLLSATSLITTLAGLFSKDLLAASLEPIRHSMAVLIGLAVLGLAGAVYFLLVGVLLPQRRPAFGNNALTNGGVTTEEGALEVIWNEYRQIHAALLDRNDAKATALHSAYVLYALAVGCGILLVLRFALLALFPSLHSGGF